MRAVLECRIASRRAELPTPRRFSEGNGWCAGHALPERPRVRPKGAGHVAAPPGRSARALAVALAAWVAVLSVLAGYADIGPEQVVAVALAALTGAAPALAA